MDYGSYGDGDYSVSQSHSYSQASVRKEPLGTVATAPMQIEQPRRSSDSHVVINPSLAGSSELAAVAAPLSVAVNPEKVSSDNVSVSSSTKGSFHSSSRVVDASAAMSIGRAESPLGSMSRKLQLMSELFQRTVLSLLPVRTKI